MKNNLEDKANSVGNFLVRSFHYLALFAIGSAIVWSAFFAFLEMAQKSAASIEDILLLFIYLELGAVVGILCFIEICFIISYVMTRNAQQKGSQGGS